MSRFILSNRFIPRLLLVIVSLGLLLTWSSFRQPTLPAAAQANSGMGVRRTTAEIMAEQADQPANRPARVKIEREVESRATAPQNPDSPALASSASGTDKGQSLKPSISQTVGLNFLGATLNDTGSYPPDTMGAIGPTQYVVAVNGRIRVFDKVTAAVGALDADMNVFFSSVVNGTYTSDPRVRYDRLSGRWIVIMINVDFPNRILLAVSDNATITGSTVWTYFFIDQQNVPPARGGSNCLADYPTLGVDASALYIGVSQFCGSTLNSSTFDNTDVFVIRKSSILGAGPIVVTPFRRLIDGTGNGPLTAQGVDNFDAAATQGYFIGTDNAVFGKLVLRQVNNPGGTPTISGNINITVATTAYPINVPHLGNTGGNAGKLDAIDDRLYAAHIRNGRLWTAHNIGLNSSCVASGSPDRVGARWYELQNINTASPSVVQFGTICDSTAINPLFYWMPSIMVSGQGHAAIGFSSAGNTSYVNAAFTGRVASDPAGTMSPITTYTASNAAYNPPYNRWGDYSYISLDPCDDMTMWAIEEFVSSTNIYGVQVAKLIAPPPPASATVNATSIKKGKSAVNVVLNGTTTNGTGFYDPGAGFACRLQAAISGGVTVNSVTYNNAGSITVNISTVGTTAGAKNVTVTNPDSQAKTFNSLFNVTNGHVDTFGVFRPSATTFYLRNSNTTGSADLSTTLGTSSDLPIVGDWNGDGIDTVGIYRNGQFFLRDSNTPGAPIVYSPVLGVPGDMPISGDWTGSGKDSIGVFRPSNGLIYLKNVPTTGFADFQMVLGIPGDVPVAGDWDGNGIDSPGVYRPSVAAFYLSNQVCNCAVTADYSASLGVGGDSPFAGDWNGDGTSGIGVFRPSNGLIYLKNSLVTGFADVSAVFGVPNDKPIAGHWGVVNNALIANTPDPKLAPTFVP